MPEELNRIVADHLSTLLFAPTNAAVVNLRREGLAGTSVLLVGDVMLDAALMFASRAERTSQILQELKVSPKDYALATIHRAENTDDAMRFAAILDGLTAVCRKLKVILPLHPRARSQLGPDARQAFVSAGGLIIDPVGYLNMIMLERNASVIVTDSGGVQKEAFFFRVPCVTLREETEWIELVELGWNVLASPVDANAIQLAVLGSVGRRGAAAAPYGDGHTSSLIAGHLRSFNISSPIRRP
jgi:UDP-GlcNAc3NAcA epimerase